MLLIIIALLLFFPGIYAYLSGRKYLAMEHNKTFALQYFKYQQHAGLIFWACFMVSCVLLGLGRNESTFINTVFGRIWGLVYLVLFVLAYSSFIVGFSSIQSTVRDERVPVFQRITFNVLHLFLILWPYLFLGIAAFGSPHTYPLRTVLIVIAYAIMYMFSFDFWKILMRAHYIEDQDLMSWCARIREATGMPAIPILIFPAAGLKFANAFFVGNYGTKKGIFMSRYAFDNLSGDELLAIYAHEIGHGQRHQVVRRSLALVIPFIALVLFNAVFHSPHIFIQLLCLVCALVTMKFLIPSQRFEKEADLFALKATDNVDAVISGLEKIYNLGILPERFAPSEEKRLSHPSLVRRKLYIQEAAGQESARITEPVVFPLIEVGSRLTFDDKGFTIEIKDRRPVRRTYNEVTSMFPKTVKDHTELAIRYTSAKEKFQLAVGYDRVVPVIDAVMPRFSLKSYIDPGRYKRSYYLWMCLVTFFGLIFTFIIGPALLVLGIIGLVKRRKTMLLSIGITTFLYFLYPYIAWLYHDGILQEEYSIVFGLIGVVCLFDYFGIRRIEEPEKGKGSISFGFSVFFLLVAFGALFALGTSRSWGHDPYAVSGAYSILFYNAVVLGTGLVISRRLHEAKRKIVLLVAMLLFFFFVLLHMA
ncbi:M48 family metalloprotease [candidate division WOR-3 bacterium]|nr:M48 family metalloprotease [candidate division WOR-3 bacterium]